MYVHDFYIYRNLMFLYLFQPKELGKFASLKEMWVLDISILVSTGLNSSLILDTDINSPLF